MLAGARATIKLSRISPSCMTGRGWCGSNSFTGGLCLFLDSNLATIVSAGRAYSVIDMKLSAVGAYCQCRRNCFVVGSSFKGPCLGLSSLWMCHFFVYLLLSNIFFNSLQRSSTDASCSSPGSSAPYCSSSSSTSPWHSPSGCTCLMGTSSEMNS